MSLPNSLKDLLDLGNDDWARSIKKAFIKLSVGYTTSLGILRREDGEALWLCHHKEHILRSFVPILKAMATSTLPFSWIESSAHAFGQLAVELEEAAIGAEAE
ncbi:hypothetical protein K439DRAFT_1614191 [Ramaria rubella]|nr:hypothetical protein K439DRAFT_1614191 [Ramaria rubella]